MKVEFNRSKDTYATIICSGEDELEIINEYYGDPRLSLMILHYLGSKPGKNAVGWWEEIENATGMEINQDLLDEVESFIPTVDFTSCDRVVNVRFYIKGVEFTPEYKYEDLIEEIKLSVINKGGEYK